MIRLRSYHSADAPLLLDLFRDTVRRVNSTDYSPVQIAAWASEDIDVDAWRQRFNDRFAYVAELDDRVVGFADMRRDGYLDRLFVSADHQRCGVARILLDQLKLDALGTGITEIFTDASTTAKRFFEASGFVVVREQSVECRGVRLTNFHMRLSL
jgi:putative acetyltransferase